MLTKTVCVCVLHKNGSRARDPKDLFGMKDFDDDVSDSD